MMLGICMEKITLYLKSLKIPKNTQQKYITLMVDLIILEMTISSLQYKSKLWVGFSWAWQAKLKKNLEEQMAKNRQLNFKKKLEVMRVPSYQDLLSYIYYKIPRFIMSES